MEELKKYILLEKAESYHEGIMDCLNNIEQSLNKVKDLDGKYPKMKKFVSEYLPSFRDIELKHYKKNKEELNNGKSENTNL